MSTSLRATAVLGALALFTAGVAAQPRLPVSKILDLYDRGDYDTALSAVASTRKADQLFKELKIEGALWIDAVDGAGRARRRLVAASLALEATRIEPIDWSKARHLVEWGCQMLRGGGAPEPLELIWHLAAVGRVESAHDVVFLVGLGKDRDTDNHRRAAIDHLEHAESRFPRDDRFALARVIGEELRSLDFEDRHPVWITSAEANRADMLLPPNGRVDYLVASALLGAGVRSSALTKSLKIGRLVESLRSFPDWPTLRAEINLRLGVAYLRLARPDLALPRIDEAEAAAGSTNTFVLYLARFFRARIEIDRGQRDAAISAYRRALEAVPRAQSASFALASLLFTGNRRDEALDVVGAAVSTLPLARDPWREYQCHLACELSQLVGRLREGLR